MKVQKQWIVGGGGAPLEAHGKGILTQEHGHIATKSRDVVGTLCGGKI